MTNDSFGPSRAVSNVKSHRVLQPILDNGSPFWHRAPKGCTKSILQDICLDEEQCDDGHRSVAFALCYQPASARLAIPGGSFIAHLENATVWDCRSLDLDRPSLYFSANRLPAAENEAQGSRWLELGRLTARLPSMVTWVLPRDTGRCGSFDEPGGKFCFGLQVHTQNLRDDRPLRTETQR